LHGAPGCGKTLIAKKLAKVLKSKKPIYVKGPEIFDPLVGRAEEKIRELFAPALADYRKLGDDSELHVVIMDEIDSIAAKRGMRQGGTGVDERVVTQLLSILDGVEDMNNILVIGMTNRIDIIDPAILRPGRLEIHVEIGLPDEKGRLQILEIHTTRMREAKRLAADVDLKTLALQTKNFTGAELSSLVKNASGTSLRVGRVKKSGD
jgi:vesicle-fusing ATPase